MIGGGNDPMVKLMMMMVPAMMVVGEVIPIILALSEEWVKGIPFLSFFLWSWLLGANQFHQASYYY